MTVIAWGGAGASAVMPTWHHGRGGPVWRFPWGHYDPCVSERGTQTRDRRALREQRNRREQKSPDGRPRKVARNLLDERACGRPSFPTFVPEGPFFDDGQGRKAA
jgi:hypothetical protein